MKSAKVKEVKKKTSKKNTRKANKALLWIGIPAALGLSVLAYYIGRGDIRLKVQFEIGNGAESPAASDTLEPGRTPTVGITEPTETLPVKEEITDEDISQAAIMFLQSVNKTLGEDHGYTQEEVEGWIRNFNIKNKESVVYDEVSFQKDRMVDLMQEEILKRIVNFHNGDFSKSSSSIEWNYIILDENVMAEELITELDGYMAGLMGSTTKESAIEYSQKITNLMGDSWLAGGYNNIIPVAKLEKSGNEVIIMTYMMMAEVLADKVKDEGNTYIRPPHICNGEPISGSDMMQQLNTAICEDGLNELSAALLGTVAEANRSLEDIDTLSLSRK